MSIELLRAMPIVDADARGMRATTLAQTKESVVKLALRRVQWTLYALAPVFLALGYHVNGKRWW
jgi:hypothetical protein